MWSGNIIKIKITNKCNLNCKYCSSFESNLDEKSSESDELKHLANSEIEVFKQLDIINKHKEKLSNPIVLITGGEPTISPYFFKILKYLSDNKIKAIIETNGLFFSKEEYLMKILPFLSENIVFDFMINGYNSDIHDYLTQYPGSFILLKKAILNFKKHNVKFYMHSVINKVNYRYLNLLAKVIVKFDPIYFRFIFIKPEGNANKYFDELIPFISLVKSELIKAFRILLDSFVQFHVENLPYCALPFFEKYIFEPKYIQNINDIKDIIEKEIVKNVTSQISNTAYSNTTQNKELAKVKFAFCKDCAFEMICDGFYEWYINRKSDDDLKPIPGGKIRSELIMRKDSPSFPDYPFDFVTDFSQRKL